MEEKLMLLGKSLQTIKRKRRGLCTLPGGTPESTGRQEERGTIDVDIMELMGKIVFEPNQQRTGDFKRPQLKEELLMRNGIEPSLEVKENDIAYA